MRLELRRFVDDGEATLGILTVNGVFECFTVEDTHREVKVVGETCIPDGTYEIKLRDAGGMTKKYAARYPFHKGMLHLQNVANFEYVYIHTGNTAQHSEGCILVNEAIDSDTMTGSKSRTAYVTLYNKILSIIDTDDSVFITVS